jgi:RNA polymerase sigma-70 factor (ECF subfamily)
VDHDANFARLMSGLRTGDPDAVAEVARRYGRILRAVVRRNLHPRLRTRLDSVDVVQDVWASFVALPPDRRAFASPRALVGFLKQVARRRAVEVYRQRFETQKADITREVPGETGGHAMVLSPTPSMCVSAGEEYDRLLRSLPEGHRVILRGLREGHDNEDIARMANVSLSTVNRVVKRLKELAGV